MMKTLDEIKGLDIYLLDQLLKDRVAKNSKILDAGCGGGRNIYWLLTTEHQVWAYDPGAEKIENILARFPALKFKQGTIEDELFSEIEFDFIICNAVLHFAENHEQFKEQFSKLVSNLAQYGLLFIRMTSNIGLENKTDIDMNGRSNLPDGSSRYLITREQVDELLSEFNLSLREPVKSVKVEDLRTMTTLVFQKEN